MPADHRRILAVETDVSRALDVVGAVVGLIVTLPLWPAIALAIKLDSPGPVFYRGTRVGRGQRPFEILKFRSMTSCTPGGLAITVAGDTRVTRVGRVLRAAKLDELPQLLNVLRGDMHLVGPRPEDPRYVAFYPFELRDIFAYRPGMTSPATVAYRDEEAMLARGSESVDAQSFYVEKVLPAKVALDLAYCRSRTIWTDLSVLVHTFAAVLRIGPGARESARREETRRPMS